MQISSAYSSDADLLTAVVSTYENVIDSLPIEPDLIILFCTEYYCQPEVFDEISRISSDTRIFGCTSSRGVMSDQGYHSLDRRGLTMMAIHDPGGAYGVAGAEFADQSPAQATRQALLEALAVAGRMGEIPALVLMSSAPGFEEECISAIESIIGTKVPIIGGSSADDNLDSNWYQFANAENFQDAIVIAVLFPSTPVYSAFQCGYQPTESSGVVTKAIGRCVMEIDKQPAAVVYNNWIGNKLDSKLQSDQHIFSETSYHPLGRTIGMFGSIPNYRLSHPESITRNNELKLFSRINEGERVYLMDGNEESSILRAGIVTQGILNTHSIAGQSIAGALVIYCAGSMFTIENRMDEVVDNIKRVLPGQQFVGSFTFGEQGSFAGGENCHGNLMVSSIVFTV